MLDTDTHARILSIPDLIQQYSYTFTRISADNGVAPHFHSYK
jgi:hypothetical protein